MKKSIYHLWYVGSADTVGVRGDDHCLPHMRDLLRDATRRFPHKILLQVSSKGIKLTQNVTTIAKNGKLKSEQAKLLIPTQNITYSTVAFEPFADVVCTISLAQESRTPMVVHCYRCDSPDTALHLHCNLQTLLNKADHQKRILQLERHFARSGLLDTRMSTAAQSTISEPKSASRRHFSNLYQRQSAPTQHSTNHDNNCENIINEEGNRRRSNSFERTRLMQKNLFSELQTHLKDHPKANYHQLRKATPFENASKSHLFHQSQKRHAKSQQHIAHVSPPIPSNTSSSTSGFASDSDNGRLKQFTTADLQNNWHLYEPENQVESQRSSSRESASQGRRLYRYAKQAEPPMQYRMFGDTIAKNDAVHISKAWKSLDNLLMANNPCRNIAEQKRGTNGVEQTSYRSPYQKQVPAMKIGASSPMRDRRPALTTSTHDLSPQQPLSLLVPDRMSKSTTATKMNDNWGYDRFWKERTKRASCFVPADNSYIT